MIKKVPYSSNCLGTFFLDARYIEISLEVICVVRNIMSCKAEELVKLVPIGQKFQKHSDYMWTSRASGFKVINVGSDTFGTPIFQNILQN